MKRAKMIEVVQDTERRLTTLLGTKVTVNLDFDLEASKINNEVRLLEHLKELVSQEFNTTWEEIQSDKTSRVLVDARSVYCHLAAKYLNASQYESAKVLKRHRTSVLYLLKRLQNFLDVKDPIVRKIESIETIFLKLITQ